VPDFRFLDHALDRGANDRKCEHCRHRPPTHNAPGDRRQRSL